MPQRDRSPHPASPSFLRRLAAAGGLAVAGALAAAPGAHAFRLSPMVAELKPAGPKATQTFVLENPGEEKIAVELKAMTRELDAQGRETRKPVGEAINIYPEQVSLEPGARRSVKVTWVGEAAPARELAFRLVATQLPVDFKPQKARSGQAGVNLQFLLQYVASLYVTPDQVAPKVELESVERLDPAEKGKAPRVRLTLRNAGTAHQLLKGARVKVNGKELPGSETRKLETENLLPGGTRVFELAWPEGESAAAAKGALQADLQFDP